MATQPNHSDTSVVTVTQDTFDQEVLASDKPTIVDFWAPWCGVCRVVEPIVKTFANKERDKVKVVAINVQDALEVAQKYGVRQLPTFITFYKGEVLHQHVGSLQERDLVKLADLPT